MSFSLPKLKIGNCVAAFLASGVQAFGMYNIHALSGVTEGGVFGVVLLLNHWLHLSPAVSSFVLNARTMGKTFIGYSLIASCGYSVTYGICEQFPPLWPEIASMPLLASIAGALFIGLGAGICVRAGGATSGDDALSMSLAYLTKKPIERFYLIFDLVVLTLSLSYIPLRRIGYSLLTVALSGQLIGLVQKIPEKKEKSRDFSAKTQGEKA